ncbi:MAG: hypothetical protein IGR93_02790 [Hydrococcus sp. C42_A2020_068]|uniref:hypothetical protein n=1 Tax=Pleurocapsa sp. PCC 7327 TaxID=118163 RepID=UPI00029FC086|nr:hypothetical protein [Pleurocapsa sp. PCC 7327]AFY76132.1 hypothetical protein Ple7327_0702 [Pleurocapsa sp. PCC 7327]MBF2019054.1 hypothetical protein [Hydrococcus sp. C42_A2020_068]
MRGQRFVSQPGDFLQIPSRYKSGEIQENELKKFINDPSSKVYSEASQPIIYRWKELQKDFIYMLNKRRLSKLEKYKLVIFRMTIRKEFGCIDDVRGRLYQAQEMERIWEIEPKRNS